MDPYDVQVTASAAKDIRNLSADVQSRAVAAISGLAESPRPPSVKKLTAEQDLYRIRVGEYRVVSEVDDAVRVISVRSVRHRSQVYRR